MQQPDELCVQILPHAVNSNGTQRRRRRRCRLSYLNGVDAISGCATWPVHAQTPLACATAKDLSLDSGAHELSSTSEDCSEQHGSVSDASTDACASEPARQCWPDSTPETLETSSDVATSVTSCSSADEHDDAAGSAQVQSTASLVEIENACLISCLLQLSNLNSVNGNTLELLLRTIKLLRACGYAVDDICLVLAHASAYFAERQEKTAKANEAGYILVLMIYLGHSHVFDETCPMSVWHRTLFHNYCSLGILSKALMRLLATRDYRLRLSDEDLGCRFAQLLSCQNNMGEDAINA